MDTSPVQRKMILVLLGLLAWGFIGCESREKPGVVAMVGDKDITEEEFKRFVESLPEGLRSKKIGLDGGLEHLQALIDKELLLLEAEKRGLEQDREFSRKVNRDRDRRILRAFYDREIRDKLEITDEELRTYFVDTGRNREVKLSLLSFRNKEEAEVALARIRRGARFETLAAQQKTGPDSASSDSHEGKFLSKDAIPSALREQVFALKAGDISGPIAYKKGYLLAQVVGERPADFERYKGMLHDRVGKEKFRARREDIMRELEAKYAPTLNAEGLKRFLSEAASSATGMDPEMVICEYKNGRITADYLIDQIESHGQVNMDLGDSAQVASFAQRVVLPEVLLLEEARRLGIAAQIAVEMDREMDRMLGDELLLREVKSKVQVSYEEAMAFHEGHPEIFSGPEHVEVQEILVETEAEARALLEQLRDGADADLLAAEHTLRPEGKNNKGRFHFHLFEAPLYGGLVEAVQKASLHQLQGPVKVEGGYSVFWVLGRGRQPSSFEDKQVQFAVKNIVTKVKQNELFDAFVAGLRQNYQDQVHLSEKNLARVGQTTEKDAMPSD